MKLRGGGGVLKGLLFGGNQGILHTECTKKNSKNVSLKVKVELR